MGRRLKFVSIFFLILFVSLALRAFDLQVLSANQIISQAFRRFDHSLQLSPNRGTIDDRSGQPLAISLDVKSAAANPRLIKHPRKTAAKIAGVLHIQTNTLVKKFSSDKYFVWIKRHLTPDEFTALKNLNIKGISFYNEAKRFYPESDCMANVLGIVGIDQNGLEGLELFYDHMLKGKPRHIDVQKDGRGKIICARGLEPEEAQEGMNLGLTIDRRIQYIAYNELKKTIAANNARSGFVIIANPYTSEIYALASFPSFNPNMGTYHHLGGHKNRAVVDSFEPGSVIKPIWIGWGLQNQLFNPSKSIFCENGEFRYHRVTIHDHEKYGWLPVRDIVKYSSNIGMVKLMDTIGAHDIFSCVDAFGMNSLTGIDFPGEPKGLIRDPGKWSSVDKANVSFGQGFSVTGIQLITAFNAMINGGMLMRPHLVAKVSDAAGKQIEQFKPTIIRKVISDETSEEMLAMLKTVALKGGTAYSAYMENYQVFGKTGTSQKIDPLTGSYSKNAFISTFIGGLIDSSGKPRLSILVSIDEPHPYYYASQVACPLFKNIASQCVNVMELRPIITVAKRGTKG